MLKKIIETVPLVLIAVVLPLAGDCCGDVWSSTQSFPAVLESKKGIFGSARSFQYDLNYFGCTFMLHYSTC